MSICHPNRNLLSLPKNNICVTKTTTIEKAGNYDSGHYATFLKCEKTKFLLYNDRYKPFFFNPFENNTFDIIHLLC